MTTITAITTSENISSGSSTVLKEKIKYIMRWNDDSSGMKIVTYVTGGSRLSVSRIDYTKFKGHVL